MKFPDYCQLKQRSRSRQRAGFTLFEGFVSMILVSATMAIALPSFKAIGLQRQSIDERFQVTTAVGNLAERIAAENRWQTLTKERLELYEPVLLEQLELKDPQVRLELTEQSNVPRNRRVRINVSWRNIHGEFVDPVTLTLWFHQMSPVHEKD
jgi:type II secretory pathway pseudopilin PulG